MYISLPNQLTHKGQMVLSFLSVESRHNINKRKKYLKLIANLIRSQYFAKDLIVVNKNVHSNFFTIFNDSFYQKCPSIKMALAYRSHSHTLCEKSIIL